MCSIFLNSLLDYIVGAKSLSVKPFHVSKHKLVMGAKSCEYGEWEATPSAINKILSWYVRTCAPSQCLYGKTLSSWSSVVVFSSYRRSIDSLSWRYIRHSLFFPFEGS